MQPLSRRTRRTYLILLIVLFCIGSPVAIFYALGYRFIGGAGFVKTGGIFLSVPYAEALVFLNGEQVGESGLLKRSFYLNDLTPGSYTVEIRREGNYSWHRTLVVESELVTDAEVLLVPHEADTALLSTKGATSTRVVSEEDYERFLEAFEEGLATTTPHTPAGRLVVENGDLFLRWESDELPPSTFCISPSYCVAEIAVEEGAQKVTSAAFFARGVVYATHDGSIFITEGDIRPTPTIAPLYLKRGAQFRIVDGRLIIKDGSALYEVSF